jgi:hypothetical protein
LVLETIANPWLLRLMLDGSKRPLVKRCVPHDQSAATAAFVPELVVVAGLDNVAGSTRHLLCGIAIYARDGSGHSGRQRQCREFVCVKARISVEGHPTEIVVTSRDNEQPPFCASNDNNNNNNTNNNNNNNEATHGSIVLSTDSGIRPPLHSLTHVGICCVRILSARGPRYGSIAWCLLLDVATSR